MLERLRAKHQASQGGGGGDIFAAADVPEQVLVANGPYGESYPVAGMAVAQIRARLRDLLDIDPSSQAFIDGNPVGEDTIVAANQVLMFSHHVGQKGIVTRSG